MHETRATLIAVLTNPTAAARLSAGGWSELIAAARTANLLGLLAERLRAHQALLPARGPARHLEGARALSDRQRRSVSWECHELKRALQPLEQPVILLKGAAYAMAGLPNSRGRLFGDIDILVTKDLLAKTELQLMLHGWSATKTDPYDQRYYRDWTHELPPMTHLRRGTVLDVHHTILPPTAGPVPNIPEMLSRARPLEGLAPLHIPCPEDLAIHCMTHFAYEGELHNGLRDLFDIDGLLRHFGDTPGFWDRLSAFAVDHQLSKPVTIGLTLARDLLGTPVPGHALQALTQHDADSGMSSLLSWCYRHAIHPLPGNTNLRSALGRAAIYLRSHALRMPLKILIPHLLHKTVRRYRPASERQT